MWKSVWMTPQGLLHLRDTSQRCFPGGGGKRSRQRREILAWWRRFRAKNTHFFPFPTARGRMTRPKKSLFFASSLILKCKEIGRPGSIFTNGSTYTPRDFHLSAILGKIGVIFPKDTFERFRIPYPAAAPLKVSLPSPSSSPHASYKGGRGFVAWKRKGEGGGGGGGGGGGRDLCVHTPEEMRPTTVRSLLLPREEKISFLFLPLVW